MALSPDDVARRTFTPSADGYHQGEVRSFLERVAAEQQALVVSMPEGQAELGRLTMAIGDQERRLDALEQRLVAVLERLEGLTDGLADTGDQASQQLAASRKITSDQKNLIAQMAGQVGRVRAAADSVNPVPVNPVPVNPDSINPVPVVGHAALPPEPPLPPEPMLPPPPPATAPATPVAPDPASVSDPAAGSTYSIAQPDAANTFRVDDTDPPVVAAFGGEPIPHRITDTHETADGGLQALPVPPVPDHAPVPTAPPATPPPPPVAPSASGTERSAHQRPLTSISIDEERRQRGPALVYDDLDKTPHITDAANDLLDGVLDTVFGRPDSESNQ